MREGAYGPGFLTERIKKLSQWSGPRETYASIRHINGPIRSKSLRSEPF